MFLSDHNQSLTSEIRARLPETLPERMGVAVSGGGDSIALMHLLAEIARFEGKALLVSTVDHGLRSEAAQEAEKVAAQARHLGLHHETLKWDGWDGTGNLQGQARKARYDLLLDWARRNDVSAVALGHTADDQAETVLMRLARASGVTGLSAMPWSRSYHGVDLLRPMLGISRQRLRVYLTGIGASWVEDPSNQDSRFDRIKAREALTSLKPLGVTPESLSRTAENLGQAHEALGVFARESARKIAIVDTGGICLSRSGFAALPQEIQRRLLVGIIAWIAGRGYPPRQSAIDQAARAVQDGKSVTLAGCQVFPQGDKSWFCRELNAVKSKTASPPEVWDSRWILSGGRTGFGQVRALGDAGLSQVPDWRLSGKPRKALLVSPAVWEDDRLIAAPLAGFANGWSAKLAPEWPEFFSSLLSH